MATAWSSSFFPSAVYIKNKTELRKGKREARKRSAKDGTRVAHACVVRGEGCLGAVGVGLSHACVVRGGARGVPLRQGLLYHGTPLACTIVERKP